MAEGSTRTERDQIEEVVADRTLCHLLADTVARHGEAPAVSWEQDGSWRTMTWREVRQSVAEAAVGLAGIGVASGDVVALMASNRPEHVIADQAVVHARGTPTTFYDTLSPDQIRYVAGDAAVKVAVLENPDYLKRWRNIRHELDALETIILMDGADEFDDVLSWEELVANGRETLRRDPARFDDLWGPVTPDDNATIIYTSGTTGPPKGVLLTHRNIVFEAEAIDQRLRLPDAITLVSYLPFAHIAERTVSIYMGTKKAAHVYYCPDVKRVVDYVTEARPHAFVGVPRVWEKVRAGILAKIETEESGAKRKLAQRAVAVGISVTQLEQRGERPSLGRRAQHALLDRLVLSKIRHSLGLDRCEIAASAAAPLALHVGEFFVGVGLTLVEGYGMTETTGLITMNPAQPNKLGTVGPALPGVEMRLADDGEVLARGPNIVPGYLNRPEETAELIDADGWCHTGDIGVIDEDGYLSIVDRKKELIITAGGKNISPANIEGMLKAHPLVGQALAYGDERPYVTALVVLDEETAPVWAKQQGLEATALSDLADDPLVVEEVQRAVDTANERLSRVEQVKRFTILPTEWTAESEELTPSLKLKRRVIHDKYRDQIDALYA